MAELIAGAATTVMGSVIGKLTAILGEKYQLARDVKDGIRFLKDELSTMDAMVQELADKEDGQIDPVAKDWRNKVRELSYDIEDCIDRFKLNHSNGGSKANFVRKAVRKVKILLQDRGLAEEIQKLKSLVIEQSERAKRYDIHQCLAASPQPVSLDPRAPALFQETRDLVGIDGPRKEVIQLLKADEMQHKVVSIYGTAGQGKTTLAMEVYHKITEPYDCRAFVSVSQTPDIKWLLRDLLSQISKNQFDGRLETQHQLTRTLREYLTEKRYLILIDDIWSESHWMQVQSALPRNDNGSRIITTTRSKSVATSCCAGTGAEMYEAKPLSDDNSHKLFFKRLLFSGEDCPQDLMEVCSDILKKCGGLPLAIISIAGLLSKRDRTKKVWDNILKSISTAVDDSTIDRMKTILLLSYFDLPHHLKSCLLYLSVFPEDYLIDCRQLILIWVAEGLIPGQHRESMEQLGRSNLNELINRSLVQPTKVGVDGATVERCRVHDVILEFIVSKAVEENFITKWNRNGFSKNYFSSKIHRLSIHQEDISCLDEEVLAKIIKKSAHNIRSINIFGPYSEPINSNSSLVKYASEILSSQVLRVLNISSYVELYLGHVKHYGLMKYLSIGNGNRESKLPEDIEKLQHLETLDVTDIRIEKLPSSTIQLKRLVRLSFSWWVQLPDEIGNLPVLEELSTIGLGYQSVKCIQGLGNLTNLKVLGIDWWYDSNCNKVREVEGHREACILSLSKLLMSLQELYVERTGADETLPFMPSGVCTPPPLWSLNLNYITIVPHKISLLLNLTILRIQLRGELSRDGINILASLPKLVSLNISLLEEGIVDPRHVIVSQGFQLLVQFTFCSWQEGALKFEPGAMTKLQRLELEQLARCQFKYEQGGLVLGLLNLAGLKHVALTINCFNATADDVEAFEDDTRGAASAHPNSPKFQVQRFCQHRMAQGCSRRPSDHPKLEAPCP